MIFKTVIAILGLTFILSGCSKTNDPGTDDPGTTNPEPVIESVTIGTQVWMQKNLNVDHYQNGDSIPEVREVSIWRNLNTGAWRYYNNDSANEKIYGKLYNWFTVNDPRGLAPAGWHIPSDSEWTVLTTYLGGEAVAGGKLKEAGTEHWLNPNADADNSSGFTALPAGMSLSEIFAQLGTICNWWSSDSFIPDTTRFALFRAVYYDDGGVGRSGTDLVNGFSVRCIKD